jgi:hypothetical protein
MIYSKLFGQTKILSLSFQFLNLEARWQRLLQLVRLLAILNNESVEETAASDLEFGIVRVLLYLD